MTRPKILFLTHRVPHPPNRGDRIRTFHFLQHLAQHAEVWLAAFADEAVSPASMQVLQQLCRDVALIPVQPKLRWARAGLSFLSGRSISAGAFESPQLKHVLRQWGREINFSATLSSSSVMAAYQQLPELSDVPAYVDLIDVDSQKWADYSTASRGWKKFIYGCEAHRLRSVESHLADWTRGIAVVSEPEANIYRTFRNTDLIRAIPNGVDVNYFQPMPVHQPQNGCVFVGVLDYKPNVDGICWFAHEVWPEVQRQRPEHRLRIVGRSPAPAVQELAQIPGVDVIGTVPDVRPYLDQAAVAVVPLHIARGVQNKVLEALAMAKPVVASPEPIVGLDVVEGIHLFRATEKSEWVEKLIRLFDDQELRRDIGAAGQAYVTANHRWEQCLTSLLSFLNVAPTCEAQRSTEAVT